MWRTGRRRGHCRCGRSDSAFQNQEVRGQGCSWRFHLPLSYSSIHRTAGPYRHRAEFPPAAPRMAGFARLTLCSRPALAATSARTGREGRPDRSPARQACVTVRPLRNSSSWLATPAWCPCTASSSATPLRRSAPFARFKKATGRSSLKVWSAGNVWAGTAFSARAHSCVSRPTAIASSSSPRPDRPSNWSTPTRFGCSKKRWPPTGRRASPACRVSAAAPWATPPTTPCVRRTPAEPAARRPRPSRSLFRLL